MRKLNVGVIVLAVLAVAPVFGQTPDVEKTEGVFNGRWWQSHSDLTVRYSYLAGLIHAFSTAAPESKLYSQLIPSGLNYEEAAKAVDAVYQDPLNGRLPVMAALQIVKNKAEGMEPADLEKIVRIWLKALAEVKPATLEATKQ
jgi:hypothetical protein